jgi:AcrR family transcriptional regulator
MAAIAKEARVALKTVYVAFETKAGLIRALWYRILRGDPEDVPVAQRDWFRTVLEEPDPVRQLQLNARNSRIVKLRVQGVGEAIRAAAGVDPDGRALWERIQADFYENQRTVVESLAAKDALKDGLDVAAATDRLWTLNHPDVWSLLVGRRGWKPEEYERWLADSSCAQLLR